MWVGTYAIHLITAIKLKSGKLFESFKNVKVIQQITS